MVLMTENVNCLCSFDMITNKHLWEIQCEILPHWRAMVPGPQAGNLSAPWTPPPCTKSWWFHLRVSDIWTPGPLSCRCSWSCLNCWSTTSYRALLFILHVATSMIILKLPSGVSCLKSSAVPWCPEGPACLSVTPFIWCLLLFLSPTFTLKFQLFSEHVRPFLLLQGLFFSLKCVLVPSWRAHFSSSETSPCHCLEEVFLALLHFFPFCMWSSGLCCHLVLAEVGSMFVFLCMLGQASDQSRVLPSVFILFVYQFSFY